jgi:hypothetical protein
MSDANHAYILAQITYVANSLTLIGSFFLVLGLVVVPDLRSTVISRIVLWIALRFGQLSLPLTCSDFLWWTSAMVQVGGNQCWVYPIDLFFSVSSSMWTCLMAVHLVLVHTGSAPKIPKLEWIYHAIALSASLAVGVGVGVTSGGYINQPGYPG